MYDEIESKESNSTQTVIVNAGRLIAGDEIVIVCYKLLVTGYR